MRFGDISPLPVSSFFTFPVAPDPDGLLTALALVLPSTPLPPSLNDNHAFSCCPALACASPLLAVCLQPCAGTVPSRSDRLPSLLDPGAPLPLPSSWFLRALLDSGCCTRGKRVPAPAFKTFLWVSIVSCSYQSGSSHRHHCTRALRPD
jgi:hypothetical protein